MPILVPRLLKNSPIEFPSAFKPLVKEVQKSLKKLPTVVASSLILSGIELIVCQILTRILEELSSLSPLSDPVSPPPGLVSSIEPPWLAKGFFEKPLNCQHKHQN